MSYARPSSRLALMVALAGLCLGVSGCGSKISKANADKINTGMTETEVSNLLGPPTESNEVALPDIGGMLGGGAPGMPTMPKKTRQSVWKEGEKAITVMFVDGKVMAKESKGL
jgi:hypothetical protein